MVLWTLFGALLGPLALVLLLIAPPGRCRYCDARVHGWSATCARCGLDVNGPRRGAAARARGDGLISVVPTQRVVSTESPALHPFVVATALNQGSRGTEPAMTTDPVPMSAPRQPEPDVISTPLPPTPSATFVPATPSPAGTVPPVAVAAAAEPAPKATTRRASKAAPKGAAKATAEAAPTRPATATPEAAPVPSPQPEVEPAVAPKRGRRKAVAEVPAAEPAVPQPIGGGVYYSGTAPLSAGLRYSLRLLGPNLQVLGPNDRDPRRVAFERSVTGADADVTDDRLVISLGDGRNTTLLVFVAVDGGKPAALAQVIRDAALANGSRP